MPGRLRGLMAGRLLTTAGAVAVVGGLAFLGYRLSMPSGASLVAGDAIAAQGPGSGALTLGTGTSRTIMVYVTGAVAHPGMYRLPAGLRVGDALAAAGGILPSADLNRLPNIVAKLTDGKQVKVPFRGQSGSGNAKVDINTAGVAELDVVPGMPPGLAQAIVDFRQAYGAFNSVTELKTLLGVDATTLSAIRKYLVAS